MPAAVLRDAILEGHLLIWHLRENRVVATLQDSECRLLGCSVARSRVALRKDPFIGVQVCQYVQRQCRRLRPWRQAWAPRYQAKYTDRT